VTLAELVTRSIWNRFSRLCRL